MTEMTPEKLAELKRLLDEATPRPWEAYHPHPHYRQYAVDAVTPEGHLGYAVATTQDVQAEANAELIATAVNALPALLDAAELLADVRDQVTRGALCPMCSTGMTRRTVGLVCPVCGTDYAGTGGES